MPRQEYFYLGSDITPAVMIEMGQSLENFLILKHFDGYQMPEEDNFSEEEKEHVKGPQLRDDYQLLEEDNFSEEREHVKGPQLREKDDGRIPCYTLFSRVNSSLDIFQAHRYSFVKEPLVRLGFDVEEDEYFTPENKPGVFFTVHSPLVDVNPYDAGYFLKLGRLYKIHINMEKEILLPYPYETDCLNYTEVWLRKGKTGYRTQEMCNQLCFLESSMKCMNCVMPSILYPHNEELCARNDNTSCPFEIIEEVFSCLHNCKDDCLDYKYTYDVQERHIKWYYSDEGKVNVSNRIFVDIYLDSEEIVTLRHIPKYMIVEVFSDIGGYIGLWLGICLLQLIDLLDALFSIARFSIRRYRSIRSGRKNDSNMQEFIK